MLTRAWMTRRAGEIGHSAMTVSGAVAGSLILLLLLPMSAGAQQEEEPVPAQRLKVFLDGNYFRIGTDYIRTEMDFVDWVRDQADADVHIIVTSESAGGGGTAYTIDFIGRQTFSERSDSLVHTSRQADTQDEIRDGVVRTMKLGLAPYLLRTPAGADIDLIFRTRRGRTQVDLPAHDPWNYWVFRTSLSGNIEGERASKEKSVNGSFSARRITEDWKLDFSWNGAYSEDQFELSSGKITNFTHTLGYNGLVARSLGEHWAVGIRTTASSSTRLNQYLTGRVAPVLEYSFFPYSDFTRRQLTLQYSIGMTASEYEELTLFGKKKEKLFNESLVIALEVTQPWGSARASVEGAHYFHDLDKFHVNASTRCDIRLFRGFSFNINGRFGRVRDQLYLASRGATDEEILLRLRKLESAFEYELRFGFSYTFGSIFNSIVNPRLQGQRRGGPEGFRR
jgi:hypothetical protein